MAMQYRMSGQRGWGYGDSEGGAMGGGFGDGMSAAESMSTGGQGYGGTAEMGVSGDYGSNENWGGGDSDQE